MRPYRARATFGQRLLLILGALLFGAIVNLLHALATGSMGYLLGNLADESGPLVFNILLAATPLLLLALRGIKDRLPWIVGMVLTLLVHFYIMLTVATGGFEKGTSVGNAMWTALVLLTSCVVITITCDILSRGKKGSSAHQGQTGVGAPRSDDIE